MGLKAYLEKIEPNFEPGGKHEKWYALYEAAATIFGVTANDRGASIFSTRRSTSKSAL